MKGQDFAHFSLFRFFSLYVLSFTMIFLFNWLVSSSFFSYGSSLIWKENATWFSLVFLLFHLPLCSLPQSSISLFFSIYFSLPLAWLSPPFRRCAVQSCSKSRVCSCWSSSIFLRLLDPGVLSCRISQNCRKGRQSRGRRPKDVAKGKRRPVLPQR